MPFPRKTLILSGVVMFALLVVVFIQWSNWANAPLPVAPAVTFEKNTPAMESQSMGDSEEMMADSNDEMIFEESQEVSDDTSLDTIQSELDETSIPEEDYSDL